MASFNTCYQYNLLVYCISSSVALYPVSACLQPASAFTCYQYIYNNLFLHFFFFLFSFLLQAVMPCLHALHPHSLLPLLLSLSPESSPVITIASFPARRFGPELIICNLSLQTFARLGPPKPSEILLLTINYFIFAVRELACDISDLEDIFVVAIRGKK